MTDVESAPRGHPGPLQSESQQEDADRELDWVLRKNDSDEGQQTRANSIPPRSHTPGGLHSPHADRKTYDTPYPRSPSPRLSPRDELATGPLRMEADEEEDDIDRYGGEPQSVGQGDDSGDEGDYDGEMTADQKMAMKELHEMKLDLAYGEEEPPEYDVKERVRQLNEELAKEPSPTEHERAIKFNENPVSLVVPPPDYPSDDEEAKDESKGQGQPQGQREVQGQATNMDDLKDDESIDSGRGESREVESVEKRVEENDDIAEEVEGSDNEEKDGRTPTREEAGEGDKNSDVGSDAGSGSAADAADTGGDKNSEEKEEKRTGDEEKVLVERNGKFELLAVNSLTAEEREMYLLNYNKDDAPSSSSKASSKGSETHSAHEPRPPRQPRPATAVESQRASRDRAPRRRVQSAKTRQIEYKTYEDYGYKSPYALTPEQKRQLERQQSRKEEQQRKKDEEETNKKKKEQEEADDAFQAWLKQKRRDASLRRKEENERRKQEREEKEKTDDAGSISDHSKRDPESAYKEWLGVKQQEKRRTRSVERAIRREQQEQYSVRPRSECDRAFRAWLRKKNADLRKQRADEYNKTRVMRLLARQSRKSQQLAQAMTHAQEFKYVDYYGYRF